VNTNLDPRPRQHRQARGRTAGRRAGRRRGGRGASEPPGRRVGRRAIVGGTDGESHRPGRGRLWRGGGRSWRPRAMSTEPALRQKRCQAAPWRSQPDGVLPVSRLGNQTNSNNGRFTPGSEAAAGAEHRFPCSFPVLQGIGSPARARGERQKWSKLVLFPSAISVRHPCSPRARAEGVNSVNCRCSLARARRTATRNTRNSLACARLLPEMPETPARSLARARGSMHNPHKTGIKPEIMRSVCHRLP